MHYFLRYRRLLVRKNLKLVFRNKSEAERRTIENKFYRWFSDMLVETIHGYRASDEEMRERVVFYGTEDLSRAAEQYGGAMLMLGHIGCWEWYADIAKRLPEDIHCHYIYRRLKSENADKAMLYIRQKRGGNCIEKKRLLREMAANRKNNNSSHIYCMLSDQKPSASDIDGKVPFFGLETPFITGTDTLARKFDYPVFFAELTMPSRGHYMCHFRLISESPKNTEPNYITQQYAHLLEQNILCAPHLWLWTHNRFKYNNIRS
mgnify:CR=1 FL=1